MNTIASFRKCALSDEELLQKVDKQTDRIFQIQRIPSRNVPADPNEDYDLLVGELLLRFKERLSTPPQEPSAKAIAEAAFNAGVDWRNGIITYGAVTNPFPDKEQYLSKFK